MRILRSKLAQAVLILAGTFLLFRFGIRPPAPWSVVTLYMTITCFAVLVYVSSDSASWEAFLRPLRATLVEDSKRPIRLALLVILPLLAGYYTYSRAAARPGAPPALRAVHPAPPPRSRSGGRSWTCRGWRTP